MLPLYLNYIDQFDGSWLVFRAALLHLLLSSDNPSIGYIPDICTEYRAFEVAGERELNTWSSNWEDYIKVGFFNSQIIEYMRTTFSIDYSILKKAYGRRKWARSGLRAFWNLRLSSLEKREDSRIAGMITKFPSYNFFDRLLLRTIISGSPGIIVFMKQMNALNFYCRIDKWLFPD